MNELQTDRIGAGTRIGDYAVTGLLGRGGMGAVYRAENVTSGAQVALKVLSEQLAGDEEFRSRFLREARYAAELDHPNVVRVLDSGESGGFVFMAQQIVEGTDLRAVLAVEGALEIPRALSILGQVARALDAVHAGGLVHRDVKPANVLIASRVDGEHVVLTDFGLSKHPRGDSRVLTAAGEFVGTLYYAAPEQVLGRDIGPEADVYSFGCMLYECLTGELPFQRERAVELLEAHIDDPPPRVTEKRPDLPATIDSVVARAMAKQPSERFALATVLMDAVRLALGDLAGPPPDAGPAPEQPPRPTSDSPSVAAPPSAALPGLRLVVTVGNAAGAQIEVEDELEIGRMTSGDGNLAGDIEISRRHARIWRDGSGYMLEDLGSTNGTFVNGRRLEAPSTLSNGDEIQMGGTTVLVESVAATTPAHEPLAEPAAPGRAGPEPGVPSLAPEAQPGAAPPEPVAGPPGEPEPFLTPAEPVQPTGELPVVGPVPRVSLRVEIDLEKGEATVALEEGSDRVRLVYREGRWQISGDVEA